MDSGFGTVGLDLPDLGVTDALAHRASGSDVELGHALEELAGIRHHAGEEAATVRPSPLDTALQDNADELQAVESAQQAPPRAKAGQRLETQADATRPQSPLDAALKHDLGDLEMAETGAGAKANAAKFTEEPKSFVDKLKAGLKTTKGKWMAFGVSSAVLVGGAVLASRKSEIADDNSASR